MFLEEKEGISTLMFDFSVFFFGWFWFERTNTEIAIKRFLPTVPSRSCGTTKKLVAVELKIGIGTLTKQPPHTGGFLDGIASPSTYPISESVGQWVSG